MRYTLFLYSDENGMADIPPEQMEQTLSLYMAYTQQLRDAGVFVDTDWLQASATGTTVTLKDGEKRVQDGPYADTKEQLGGVYVIDVPDLDAAMKWAEKCPAAHHGIVEIRASRTPDG